MLFLSMMSLAMESNEVIGSRCMKIAAGGFAGIEESRLMFDEKVWAGFETLAIVARGGSLVDVIAHYRRQVAANAKRLEVSQATAVSVE